MSVHTLLACQLKLYIINYPLGDTLCGSDLGGLEFWIKYLYMHFKPNYCRHMTKDVIYMLGGFEGHETTVKLTAVTE